LLQALDQRVEEEARIRVWVAEDPMSCVARGAGMILEKYDALRHLLVGLERGSTRHN
jgi:rod shape-determining protein MreB